MSDKAALLLLPALQSSSPSMRSFIFSPVEFYSTTLFTSAFRTYIALFLLSRIRNNEPVSRPEASVETHKFVVFSQKHATYGVLIHSDPICLRGFQSRHPRPIQTWLDNFARASFYDETHLDANYQHTDPCNWQVHVVRDLLNLLCYAVQRMRVSAQLYRLNIAHRELPSSSCLPSCLKLLLRLSPWVILFSVSAPTSLIII